LPAPFSHQGVDFAGIDGQVDVTQCRDAKERLRDPAHLEDRVAHPAFSPGAPMTAIASYPRLCLQDQRELTH
jgi:hypothetical protein